MPRAFLGLGSNLGNRVGHLREAVASLPDLVAVSPVYETDPVGGPTEQGAYLNLVAELDTPLEPRALLDVCRRLEIAAARVRDVRWGPRTLDVDVIAVSADDGTPVVSADPELTLPHPRAHLRAFVLRPWLDIQPYADLPGHGRLFDLVRADPVASDLGGLRARDDISLET